MSDDEENESDVEVPVIPVPQEDTLDDAANKEAAGINSGRLEMYVQGSIRSMKGYTITSVELDGLSTWSTLKNTAYTIAFSLFSFSLGLFVQISFSGYETVPEIAKAICFLGIPAGLVLGLITLYIGWYLSGKSQGLRDTIEKETAHNGSNNASQN